MTRQRVLLIFLLIIKFSIGQIDSTDEQIPEVSYLKGSGGLLLGGHFIGKTITGEIGFVKSKVTKVKDYPKDLRKSANKTRFWLQQPYSTVSVGSEFFFTGDRQLCIGPKIGFDYSVAFILHARLNVTYYTSFGNVKDLRVSPALGLSLGPVIVMYNYNYPIFKTRFDNIATNRISLICYIAKRQ